MTVREAITRTATAIDRRDAEQLLLHLLQRDRPWLLAHPEAELSPATFEQMTSLALRRARHEPLQYLLGRQEFFGLDLRVTPDVLIPRPETELLVEAVLHWARAAAPPSPLRILDVGTGSGAIALALAAHLPAASVTGVDLSPAALAVAQGNAFALGLAERVQFTLSDLIPELPSPEVQIGEQPPFTPWDAIVSNPPYIPVGDAAGMQPEVRDFEPHTALFAGADGLEVYRRLIPQAWSSLRPGGLLALEFGFGQRGALSALLENWHSVHFLADLAGIPRVALAQRPHVATGNLH